MLRFLLVSAFLLGATPVLAEDPAESTKSAPSIRDVVEAGNYLFQRAFEEADAGALADLYTEDGRVLPPGTAPIIGRPGIAAFWAEQMKSTQRVRLETSDVESDGNLAVEQGVAQLIAHDGSVTSIQYIVVWKRIGRRWHLHRDIWNAAPAPEAEAPAGPGAPTDEVPAQAPTEAAPPGATGTEVAP